MQSSVTENKSRWLYIPLGLIIFMCMGTIYSWSIFRKPIETAFNIGATESGLPYMVFLVFYALAMPFAGSYMDKYGPKVMTIVGGIFISIGWFLSGFTSSIIVLTISYGVIGGMGVGIAYGAPMAVAAKWFPDKEGLAVGLTLGGFGLSPFITAPAASWLIRNFGAFTTFKILGVLFAVIITLLALPLKFPETNKKDSKTKQKKNLSSEIAPEKMLKSRSFYALWTTFVIGTIIGLMAIAISGPVAVELINLDSTTASIYVSLFAIFNGIGRPIFGALTDKLKAKKTAIISFSLIIIASLLMIINTSGSPVLYFMSFSIFWLNLGGWLAIAPAATSYFFGKKNYSQNYGYLFTAYGVGAVIGNLFSGSIRDIMGSYQYVFYPTLIIAAIGIIISFLFLKKDRVNNSEKETNYSAGNV
ncbi:putative MFS family arabinose efflux permease [Halanaerobium saccharolyticum]|uniref:Putative MFS family arabinose efflux permease n=1 Tax=Halanaerobium saccharolyticum TaxID=43595 RepID=A0A4R6LIH5_9FIRM|nr:OFA family MFS transporter [Halanaerobium saccharolyticum]TDO78283.1 putative MFS family arabinose efflux permease [Halanaerobium saccharolyticum]